MAAPAEPRRVVLLGVGHTHAQVVRQWARRAPAGARLTCVSNFPTATYSGMLPGVLSGQYEPARMRIELPALCRQAGAELLVGDVTAIDVPGRRLCFRDGPESHAELPWDLLSVGIGSVPERGEARWDEQTLPIKPMQTFLPRLLDRLERLRRQVAAGELAFSRQRPLRVTIVGGGAGGLEIAFCLPARLRRELGNVATELTLVDAHDELGSPFSPRTARLIRQTLDERGVLLRLGARVSSAANGCVELVSGEAWPADLTLWATGATAPPLLASAGLPIDDRGFLLTDRTLRSTAGAPVFAVGDAGTIHSERLPKAGVYAVRQAPILWENLCRLLADRPPIPYRPQRRFLKLLNTGDGRAILDYGPLGIHARWCWWWKDRIDRRFVRQYQ